MAKDSVNVVDNHDKVHFEDALNRTGFGLYNIYGTLVSGLMIIGFACIAYGNNVIVPTSACDLDTTGAQQGILAAAPFIGSIIGAPLWGFLGDTRGRRNMLIVSLLSSAVVNGIASISVNWVMLMILQFFATLLASGIYSLAITLLSESVPMARRNLLVLLVASIFLLSQGLMALLAMPIIPLTFSIYLSALDIYWNSWRTVVLVYSLPNLLSLFFLLFIYESPKFLMLKGNEEGAIESLRKIHKFNRNSGVFDVKALQREETGQKEKLKMKDQFVPLFKAPLLRYTLLITALFVFKQVNAFLVWLPRIANQFVQVLQTGEGYNLNLCGIIRESLDAPPDQNVVPCALDETALLIVFGVAVLQSLVNLGISFCIDMTGRRNMVIITTSVMGLSGVLVNLVPNAIGSAVFFVIFAQGIITTGLYTAMCVALFPTYLRTMAVALTLTGSRIATFAAIQILNYLLENNCEVGFYLFTVMFASSAIIAFFLPDDRSLKDEPEDELKTEL